VADASAPGPEAQVSRLYEQAETQAARASEELVGSRGFAGLLSQFAENTAAVTKRSSDLWTSCCATCGLPAGAMSYGLVRQLARTEDKLGAGVARGRTVARRARARARPEGGLPGQSHECPGLSGIRRPRLRASEVSVSALQTRSRLPRATVEFSRTSSLRSRTLRSGWRRGTSLDASRDDALPLQLEPARARGPDPARVRVDQSSGNLRIAAGSSFVEFLHEEGFDVYLVDWGFPTRRTPTWD
jgi:hypothetical protein